MKAHKRSCPQCQQADRYIYAVLNDIRGNIYDARCYCSVCGATWDELHDAATGETTDYLLMRGNRPEDTPGNHQAG